MPSGLPWSTPNDLACRQHKHRTIQAKRPVGAMGSSACSRNLTNENVN